MASVNGSHFSSICVSFRKQWVISNLPILSKDVIVATNSIPPDLQQIPDI